MTTIKKPLPEEAGPLARRADVGEKGTTEIGPSLDLRRNGDWATSKNLEGAKPFEAPLQVRQTAGMLTDQADRSITAYIDRLLDPSETLPVPERPQGIQPYRLFDGSLGWLTPGTREMTPFGHVQAADDSCAVVVSEVIMHWQRSIRIPSDPILRMQAISERAISAVAHRLGVYQPYVGKDAYGLHTLSPEAFPGSAKMLGTIIESLHTLWEQYGIASERVLLQQVGSVGNIMVP